MNRIKFTFLKEEFALGTPMSYDHFDLGHYLKDLLDNGIPDE